MLYNPPTGATDPNAPYVGKNTAAGTQGSRIPPAAIEGPQRELVAPIIEAGIAPTNTDYKQLLRAIRSGKLWTFQDTGSQNALVITPLTPHVSVFLGLPFRVIPAYTCTGPATIVVNTFGAVPLKRRDGSALTIGDYIAGVPIDIWNDGLGNFRLMDIAFSEVPRVVAAPTVYVRTDGSDLNDGSANTPDKAFATISAALTRATSTLFLVGKTLTVQLGIPGTYAAPGLLPAASGAVLIRGDANAQANYIISGAGPGSGNALIVASGVNVTLQGLTIANTGTTNGTLAVGSASMTLANVTLSSNGNNGYAHLLAGSGGTIAINAGCIVSGSMAYLMAALSGSIQLALNTALTVLNTPTFSQATAFAQSGGSIIAAGGASISGSANGTRYRADLNGTINTNGAGVNFFPGSTAGSNSNGGQYA